LLTQFCDKPPNDWAFKSILALFVLVAGYMTMLAYQRRVDGPLP